ncbi:Holliday junction resolvase RuvX [Candidatus Kaiserbacteria bacterium]|nr:Holliday junction resolvase RuvX [Candidatus Kaiserbacteria bacterium]
MRHLGIDYGSKRLGLALSDEEGGFAFPYGIIPNDAKVLQALASIIETESVGAIVVGDTLSLEGGTNRVTEEAQKFVDDLTEFVDIPVHRVREAWSSAEAMRFAPPGKRHDDSAAAAIILQRFLDRLGK